MKLKDLSLKLKAGFLWNARYGSVVYSRENWKIAPEKLKKTQGFMFKSDFLGDSGSDEVTECYGETECYVEDASPLINSSPVAQTVSRRRRQSLLSGDSPTGDVGLCISAKKPVPKKKRPLTKADIVMMRSFTTPLSTREIELQMEGSPQVNYV